MPDEQQLLDLIATSNQGVVAAVTSVGYPHLTNVLYVWDSAEKMARVSTTDDRVKGRIRNPVDVARLCPDFGRGATRMDGCSASGVVDEQVDLQLGARHIGIAVEVGHAFLGEHVLA
jgi:hypothetical protein